VGIGIPVRKGSSGDGNKNRQKIKNRAKKLNENEKTQRL